MKRSSILTILAAAAVAASAQTDGIIAAVKSQVAPDARQEVFEVTLADGVLRGKVSDMANLWILTDSLDAAGVEYVDSVEVFGYDSWALVRIPVATLRTRPAHSAEVATQAVMGTPVRVLETTDEWMRVQTPDHYIAWVPDSSVSPRDSESLLDWQSDNTRLTVITMTEPRDYADPTGTSPRDVVSQLVLNAVVEAVPDTPVTNGRRMIKLPDGQTAWADVGVFQPITEWASQPFDAEKIMLTAHTMMGSPYLWGGTSSKSVDCSGLAKISYLSNGIILLRDASQQARTGHQLDPEDIGAMEKGDLLFFGNRETGRVTHVAIYDSEGMFIHSSGLVRRNSLDRESPLYLYSPLSATRIYDSMDDENIRPVSESWYFAAQPATEIIIVED